MDSPIVEMLKETGTKLCSFGRWLEWNKVGQYWTVMQWFGTRSEFVLSTSSESEAVKALKGE